MSVQAHEHLPLATVVQLASITLREFQWTMPDIQVPGGLQIFLNPSFALNFGSAEGTVAYRIITTLPGAVQIEDQLTEIFKLTATLQAHFTFPAENTYELREYKSFGDLSVFPMVYPYIRELVNNTAYRAGLPGIFLAPLPYNRLTQSPVELAES